MIAIPDVDVPSAIDCPECSTPIPLTLPVATTRDRDSFKIRLSAAVPEVTRAMVEHILNTHGRPDSDALADYITERVALAQTSTRVQIEEILAAVGMVPADTPGRYTFPASKIS